MQHQPDRIQLRHTDHEYRSDDRNILSIDGVKYNVSIDSMGLNPEDDTVVACEDALERAAKEVVLTRFVHQFAQSR